MEKYSFFVFVVSLLLICSTHFYAKSLTFDGNVETEELRDRVKRLDPSKEHQKQRLAFEKFSYEEFALCYLLTTIRYGFRCCTRFCAKFSATFESNCNQHCFLFQRLVIRILIRVMTIASTLDIALGDFVQGICAIV